MIDEEVMCKMRTDRPISINNSICHGICNYNCYLCGINKESYNGPKEFQSEAITQKLIARIIAAAKKGVEFRIITNSGSGEPTLHPDFRERMDMFGDMIRDWDNIVPAPELSIVTNGSHLLRKDVLQALIENPVTVNISFPTCNVSLYRKIMYGENKKAPDTFDVVSSGIDELLKLQAAGSINKICFHMSPPLNHVIRNEFENTLSFLSSKAAKYNIEEVEIVMFPNVSNRTGLVAKSTDEMDFYTDLFELYSNKKIDGVFIKMTNVWKRFFSRYSEIQNLIDTFNYPCIWNGNLFITASGDSICCNDQAVRNVFGNIKKDGIESLISQKEDYLPNSVCFDCNQKIMKQQRNIAEEIMLKL